MANNKGIIAAVNLLHAVLLQNDEKDELQLKIQEFLKGNPIAIDMTEDEFYNEFNPIKNHIDDNASFDGCMFETYGKELDFVKASGDQHIWTIVEADGKMFITSGYHFVDRIGYLITEEEFKEGLDITVAIDTETNENLNTAKLVEEIRVVDPDSKGEVDLAIYKHQNGGMFAMDISFLDQVVISDDFDRPIIPDPFTDNGTEDLNHVVLFD